MKQIDDTAIVNRIVPITALRDHPDNFRYHPEEQLEQLAASYQRFGQFRSVVCQEVSPDAYLLVAGHGIVEAMRREGVTDVRVDVLSAGLSAEEVKAILVADNLLPGAAQDDEAMLVRLIQEQRDAGFSLASIGADEELLQQLLASVEEAQDEQVEGSGGDEFDTTPQEDGPTRTQVGDIWQLGKHRLLVGDCTIRENVERLMQGQKADMMFTDPPYGVDYSGGGHFDEEGEYIHHNREALVGDKSTAIYPLFLPVVLPFIDGPCYMWFSDSKVRDVYNAVHDNQCEVHALLIWHKINATYAALHAQYKQRHEPCLYFKPKGSTLRWIGPTDECTIWELPRDAQNTFHPTQKPISLSARAISNHEVKIVLDVFGGSGSTLIACERARKICYIMEIEPRYVDVILSRFTAETGIEPIREQHGA